MKEFSVKDELNIVRLLHTATIETVCNDADYDATETLKYGLIFIDNNGNVLEKVNKDFALAIIDTLGINSEIWSGTFRKSWDKVETASIEQLVLEQVIHYMSTYGMESIGLSAMPVIPCEAVISDKDALPSTKAFIAIRVVDQETALKIVENYIKTIKAPHKRDVDAIIDLMKYTNLLVNDIKSFELKIARCKQLDTVPTDGQDFLRYVIYSISNSTLLIKNKKTIETLKAYCSAHPAEAYRLLSKCDEVELAKIFYRFKPIILAFKSCRDCRPIVNRIRRLAIKYHKPLSDVNVANVMKLVGENRITDVTKVLSNADNRTLIKLINFATMPESDVKVYNIRNGSTFVTERKTNEKNTETLLALCYAQLIMRNKNKLNGKTYLIPSYIDYAIPVSEKQMVGNIPYGTIIHTTKTDTITPAIWWKDYKYRTDIDFHLSNATQHFGWNGYCRNRNRSILYSGDVTSAPNGASEAYRITIDNDEVYTLNVSLFSGENNCPFKFMLTDVDITNMKRSPVNVEDALLPPIDLKFIDTRQMNLGFIKGNSFCFYGSELGNAKVPNTQLNAKVLDATVARTLNMFKFSEFIELCGGRIINDMSEVTNEEATEVISLEPNALTATTLFEIVD